MRRLRLALGLGAAVALGETIAALAAGGAEPALLATQAPIAFLIGLATCLAPLPLRWLPVLPVAGAGLFHLVRLVAGGLSAAPRAWLPLAAVALVVTLALPRLLDRPVGQPMGGLRRVGPMLRVGAAAYVAQAAWCAWLLFPLERSGFAWTPLVALAAAALAPLAAAAVAARRRPSVGLPLAALVVVGAWPLAWPLARAAHTQLPAPPAAAADAPDVVLVVLDTTRADRLSLYGYDRPTTPRLEELAGTSTLYTRAISPAIWTLPGHAAIFTGLYGPEHGADWDVDRAPRLPRSALTLAERFRLAGYRTACVASNHLFGARFGLTQGFELAWSENPQTGHLLVPFLARELAHRVTGRHSVRKQLGALERGEQAPAGEVIDVALRWLDATGDDRPRLLFLNLMEAHGMLRPCPCDAPVFGAGRAWNEYDVPARAAVLAGEHDADAEAVRRLGDWYDSQIACLDHHLGELFDALGKRGVLDRALVVVTSDHGEMLGDRRAFNHKGEVWEGLVHVPLLIRAPGQQAAVVCDSVVETGALAAALPRLAGLPPVEALPGWAGRLEAVPANVRASLLEARPLAAAPCPLPARVEGAVSIAARNHRMVQDFGQRWDRSWTALRVDELKLFAGSGGERLAAEVPSEPIASAKEALRPPSEEELALMAARLEAWGASLLDARDPDLSDEGEEERLQALRALGYVGERR